MWSLPDISRLNEEASRRAKKEANKTTKQILRGQRCDHCEKKATVFYDWYDIFSDDPKGRIFLCDHCDGYYGYPDEGYFHCEDCDRIFIDNYTWEMYKHETDGGTICLNCYLDREIANDENWISSPKDVTEERVMRAKHLIPVAGEYWKQHLNFVGNVEFDSMSGERLYGTREDGIRELKELVKKAGQPVMLILDAAYQFAVSIGVYTRK